MNVSIIGSGIVGYAIGKGFAALGNSVVFHDINPLRLSQLENDGYSATGKSEEALAHADVVFICVPTPTKNKKIDLTIMKSALRDIAEALKNKKGYCVLAIKSTIVPTTTEQVLIPLVEEVSGKSAGKDFGVCFNPEFLRAKNAFEDFMQPDRIVIGAEDHKTASVMEKLYAPFTCPMIKTDLKTAEMMKYANNCFYAAKISFFNEMHMVCEKLDIDSHLVRKVVQLDKFYATHPWDHGKSFGGPCLPKDLQAFISFCREKDIHQPVLLESVWKVNEMVENKQGIGLKELTR